MFITIVAVICHLNGPLCMEKIVAQGDLGMQSCMLGEPAVAEWMNKNYPDYRLARWKCIPGKYYPKDAI